MREKMKPTGAWTEEERKLYELWRKHARHSKETGDWGAAHPLIAAQLWGMLNGEVSIAGAKPLDPELVARRRAEMAKRKVDGALFVTERKPLRVRQTGVERKLPVYTPA